jgi:hypothetical protein
MAIGRSDIAANEASTPEAASEAFRISPKRSLESPLKNPVGAPSRPSAIAVLKTEPPGYGANALSPSVLSRGNMSIRASPAQRIIEPVPNFFQHYVRLRSASTAGGL